MNRRLTMRFIACAAVATVVFAGVSWRITSGLTTPPPAGVYDIPAGFDFPADQSALDGFRATGDAQKQRAHVWNVFAGMTQPTPDKKYAVFETWYSEDETFQTGPVPQGKAPHRIVRRFRVPRQFQPRRGVAAPQAAGETIFSDVLYNFAAYNHIRAQRLFDSARLDQLQKSGAKDTEFPDDTAVPSFPNNAVALKTVWWPVAKDKLTPLPVWDPGTFSDPDPNHLRGHSPLTWPRVVAIDATRQTVPAGTTAAVNWNNKAFPTARVVGIGSFHAVAIDAPTLAIVKANPALLGQATSLFSRPPEIGDFVVFVGTHLTTKEIGDWVWATFWWHDRPDDGPYAADRPASVSGPWRNYLMSTAYDAVSPKEADGTPHITFNPYVEARFAGGMESNCMNCHSRSSWHATWSGTPFLPIFRGPANPNDPAYAAKQLRTDFLWSVALDPEPSQQ